MESEKLKEEIIDSLNSGKEMVQVKDFIKSGKENETLFFLKPEFFQLEDPRFVEVLLDFVLKKIKEFDIEISGVLTLSGKFLKENKIIERHYGVINKLSVEGSKILEKSDKEKIKNALKVKDLKGYRILGGHELIEEFEDIDEDRVTEIWYKKNGYRIGEGFYVQTHNINGENIILINGFNPSQIKHYTGEDSRIVLFLLETDTDWHKIRNDFVGDTFPEKAKLGSIREILYENSDKYGIETVDVAKNFVHASSGPFDALFEICNFIGSINGIGICKYDTNIFNLMKKEFNLEKEDFERCLEDPVALIDGEEIDLYSYTKNKNTIEAIKDYIKYFKE